MLNVTTYAELAAKSDAAVRRLLLASGRTGGGVLVRREFVWQRAENGRIRPGPLAQIVRRRDSRLLEAYLLLLTYARRNATAVKIPTVVWLDALGLDHTASGAVALSKLFRRLETNGLVTRDKSSRVRALTLQREDASGEAYSDPGLDESRSYFKLRFEYWSQGWHSTLTLPEKAVLLIGLSLGPTFALPAARSTKSFGLSVDTLARGGKGLIDKGLMAPAFSTTSSPDMPVDFSSGYVLCYPFSRENRDNPGPIESAIAQRATDRARR